MYIQAVEMSYSVWKKIIKKFRSPAIKR